MYAEVQTKHTLILTIDAATIKTIEKAGHPTPLAEQIEDMAQTIFGPQYMTKRADGIYFKREVIQ